MTWSPHGPVPVQCRRRPGRRQAGPAAGGRRSPHRRGAAARGEGLGQDHPGPGPGRAAGGGGAVRGPAARRHRGPGGRHPRPARGARRRRGPAPARPAGPGRRRGALRRRDQPAGRPPGGHPARRGRLRGQHRRARRDLPTPPGPLRAGRLHEPRGGRAAAPAARPFRSVRRGAGPRRPGGPGGGRAQAPVARSGRQRDPRCRPRRRRHPGHPPGSGPVRHRSTTACWWRRRSWPWPWARRACGPIWPCAGRRRPAPASRSGWWPPRTICAGWRPWSWLTGPADHRSIHPPCPPMFSTTPCATPWGTRPVRTTTMTPAPTMQTIGATPPEKRRARRRGDPAHAARRRAPPVARVAGPPRG